MSFLDIDERLLDLADWVEFDRSPLTDLKHCGVCDIGLIEGGLSNQENLHVLQEFRKQCKIIVAVGACAITGGVPAMRNNQTVADCLNESYLTAPGTVNPHIPDDPEIPRLLDKVHPIQDAITVDYFLPGCPPSADVIWHFLTELLAGRDPVIEGEALRYD